MNEIFDRLTTQFPKFISTFFDLICGPRKFFSNLRQDRENNIGKALEFVVSCLFVSFFFQLFFVKSARELGVIFLTLLVVFVVTCCLITTANKAGFKVVGGTASFKQHLIITFYVTGPVYIIGSIFGLMSQGLIMVHEPAMLDFFKSQIGSGALKTKESTNALFNSKYGLGALTLYMAGHVLSLAWILCNWGAYRLINKVSRMKSAIAFCVALAILIPLSWLISVIRDTFNLLIFGIG